MAHGIEQALRQLGPYRARLHHKRTGRVFWGTIVGLKRIWGDDQLIFVTVENIDGIAGVKAMDVATEDLASIHYPLPKGDERAEVEHV